LRSGWRRLDLNVECADGTWITGKAYVQSDPRELAKFEREFADDIASLQSGQSGPATIPRKPRPR
jgi:hypothetical protein